jgi:hypothetical protein
MILSKFDLFMYAACTLFILGCAGLSGWLIWLMLSL